MNLHPLQKYIDKRKLIDSLEKVAIEMVNLVGIDIETIRSTDHCRNILQFISGLGPRKAFDLIEKVKEKCPSTRKQLIDYLKGSYVYVNCSPFIRFEYP
jgi:transcription elongation factor SPT6